jgi:DNA-directed RNA polymerase subunit RPC12/RpoP
MGIKNKLNKKIEDTLSTSDEFFRSRRKSQDKEPVEEIRLKEKIVGSKPCVACGAPVPIDKPACAYCTTVNAYYVDPNTSVEPKQGASEKEINEYTIKEIIKKHEGNKVNAIKELREVLGLGLLEAQKVYTANYTPPPPKDKGNVEQQYLRDDFPIRCPHCNSPMAIKKKRSATKHTVAALATGGLSLATLAIPNKKYKCATCGKTFKIK